MKISVITPSRNEGAAIGHTLSSVYAQSHPDVEHIVVDAFSRDATPAVLAAYPRTRVLSRPARGVYDALNFGLSRASGDVLGLLHANDRFASPGVLSRVAAAFDEDSSLDFVFGDVVFSCPGDGVPSRRYSARDFSPRWLLSGYAPPHPSLYVRRRCYEAVGPYATRYAICGDFDMWIRLFIEHGDLRWRWLPLDMVAMSPGGLSGTLAARLWRNNVERLRVLRAHRLPASPLRLAKKYWIMYKLSRND